MLEQTVALTGSSTRLLVRNYRYDDVGQLTDLHDNRRGDINYRYDPLGRLLGASSQHKEETFAFDPASNLLDPKAPRRPIHHPPPTAQATRQPAARLRRPALHLRRPWQPA